MRRCRCPADYGSGVARHPFTRFLKTTDASRMTNVAWGVCPEAAQPRGVLARWRAGTVEVPVKHVTLIALAACTLGAGCATYTERTVVEKPVPARTVYTETTPATVVPPPATTTTVYTTR